MTNDNLCNKIVIVRGKHKLKGDDYMKCKCQMISELIERNRFLERQMDYAISIESAFELMEVVSINEERINKLKKELMQ